MALSRVGGSSAAATSIAIPAHVAGDLIVIWAYRDGSTTPPTVPAAGGTVPSFTVIDGPTGANSCAAVCAYAVATGTTDTSGTWANATGISVEVWRGAASPPIGGHAQSGASVASGGNIAIPAITLQDPSGHSAILAFAGWQTVTAWSAAPAGYTQRSQVATECEALSKNVTTSDGAFNVSGTASATGGTRTQQIEILADLGNRVSQEAVEVVYKTSGAKARVSQEAVETVYRTSGAKARVSQDAVEVLQKSIVSAKNRVSQIAVETLIFIPSTIIITPPSGTFVYQGDSPTVPIQLAPATYEFAADEPIVYPALATNASFTAIGDDPTLTGAIQVESGVSVYAGDSPELAGPTIPARGAFRFLAGNPTIWTAIAPVSGKAVYQGDAPTVYPIDTLSGQYELRGDSPTLQPAAGTPGRFVWKGDGAVTYPVAGVSGTVIYQSDAPTLKSASFVIEQGGIIRWRADTPTVTPLSGPPPPPPPTPGAGVHGKGRV